jgi:hypothetical protein
MCIEKTEQQGAMYYICADNNLSRADTNHRRYFGSVWGILIVAKRPGNTRKAVTYI